MPWCDTCSRFFNPNSVSVDGCCPSCGATLARESVATKEEVGEYRPPWHFWILVVAAVVYLGWRAVQMIGWLVT